MFKYILFNLKGKKFRVLEIPEEHMAKVINHWDIFKDASEGACLKRYKLWMLINKVLPETAEDGTNWRLNTTKAKFTVDEIDLVI